MILLDIKSPCQRIVVRHHRRTGIILELDGMVQFVERVEHEYHEALAVVPLLFCNARSAFIGGGGDGLAATRLLRGGVEDIVLCDYDPEMTRLARANAELARVNQGSLRDPRVTVVNEDAFARLENTSRRFDLIVLDFPDACFQPLNRLYSRELYAIARERLTPGGVVVVQTLDTPAAARLVGATLRTAFSDVRLYRVSGNGFTLAAPQALVRQHPVPAWTRFLTEDLVDRLFALPRAIATQMAEPVAEANSATNNLLVETTLVDLLGPQCGYPTAAGRFAVWVDRRIGRRGKGVLQSFLRGLDRRHQLLIYLDAGLEGDELEGLAGWGYQRVHELERLRYAFDDRTAEVLDAAWPRLGTAAKVIGRIDSVAGRPREFAGAAELLREHLRDHAPHLREHAEAVLDEPAGLLLLLRTNSQPLAVFRWIQDVDQRLQVDMIHGRWDTQEREIAIATFLTFVRRDLGGAGIDLLTADADLSALLRAFGAKLRDRLLVLAQLDAPSGTERRPPWRSACQGDAWSQAGSGMHNPIHDYAEVRPSPIHGFGLFARESIPKGTVWYRPRAQDVLFVGREQWQVLTGSYFPDPELGPDVARELRDAVRSYAVYEPSQDAMALPLDDARFVNHSEHPNSVPVDRTEECIALRDITAGEEITEDYTKYPRAPWM